MSKRCLENVNGSPEKKVCTTAAESLLTTEASCSEDDIKADELFEQNMSEYALLLEQQANLNATRTRNLKRLKKLEEQIIHSMANRNLKVYALDDSASIVSRKHTSKSSCNLNYLKTMCVKYFEEFFPDNSTEQSSKLGEAQAEWLWLNRPSKERQSLQLKTKPQ